MTYSNICSLPLSPLPCGHPSLLNSSRTVSTGAIYLATCFVTFIMYRTPCQMFGFKNRRKKTPHAGTILDSKTPCVPQCSTLKKAIRVVCGNGWHMWKLASLRSVFNLTQFQSTFSNRWASLRDYTWPPGQPRLLPHKARHSNSCWVIHAILMSCCFPPTLCATVDNWKNTISTLIGGYMVVLNCTTKVTSQNEGPQYFLTATAT